MAQIAKLSKLDEVFVVPMNLRILNMDGCLRFMLFLGAVSAEPVEGEAAFAGDCKFSAAAALKAIEACFNEGVQSLVWNRVDDAVEDQESDSGSD